MEWLLFIFGALAVLSIDGHNPEDDEPMTQEVRRNNRNLLIAAGVFFTLGAAVRIFYTIHGG